MNEIFRKIEEYNFLRMKLYTMLNDLNESDVSFDIATQSSSIAILGENFQDRQLISITRKYLNEMIEFCNQKIETLNQPYCQVVT